MARVRAPPTVGKTPKGVPINDRPGGLPESFTTGAGKVWEKSLPVRAPVRARSVSEGDSLPPRLRCGP